MQINVKKEVDVHRRSLMDINVTMLQKVPEMLRQSHLNRDSTNSVREVRSRKSHVSAGHIKTETSVENSRQLH